MSREACRSSGALERGRADTLPAAVEQMLVGDIPVEMHLRPGNRVGHAGDPYREALAEDILDIADDATNDWMERKDAEGENAGWQFNGEATRRSQIRIDSRKWLLSKLAPKKYGDKVTQEHTGAVTVTKIERVIVKP